MALPASCCRAAEVNGQALLFALLLGVPAQAATVLSIGDGDTLRVSDRGRRITIRMACLDAPEISQSPHGMQARRLLASLAPIGSEVNLRIVTTDRYGRSVAEVIKANQNLNLLMVRRGQAFAYRQYLSSCDATAYLQAERGAEMQKVGVWASQGGIQRPWDYRRKRSTGPRTSQASSGRITCQQIGSFSRAQQLLQQGHRELDRNGDGVACESLRP
jgi:micrococcal nuclease